MVSNDTSKVPPPLITNKEATHPKTTNNEQAEGRMNLPHGRESKGQKIKKISCCVCEFRQVEDEHVLIFAGALGSKHINEQATTYEE
jgi:hypothetical protein